MKNLINAADIKAHTQASPNADDSKLNKAVPDATDAYLRPLLGLALLGQLRTFVADAPEAPTLTGLSGQDAHAAQAAYATAWAAWRTPRATDPLLRLWEALKPCLAQWALVEAWPDLLVHIDAAGIVQKVGGGSAGTTSADVATLNQGLEAHRVRGVRRGEDLVRWLESNSRDYPAYTSMRPLATNRSLLEEGLGGISL